MRRNWAGCCWSLIRTPALKSSPDFGRKSKTPKRIEYGADASAGIGTPFGGVARSLPQFQDSKCELPWRVKAVDSISERLVRGTTRNDQQCIAWGRCAAESRRSGGRL